MKKSISLALGILICFMLVDRIAFYGIQQIEKNVFTGNGVGKVNAFFARKDAAQILIFGNSRASHHVNPSQLSSKNSFNIGVDGTNLAYSDALIQTLKTNNPLLLVHIDHNSLYNPNYTGDDALSLLFKADVSPAIEHYIKEHYKEDYRLSELFKGYAYNGLVFTIVKNALFKQTNFDTVGYEPIHPTATQIEIFSKMRKENDLLYNMGIQENPIPNPNMVSIIKNIQGKAKSLGSKLVFFTSPSLSKVDPNVQAQTTALFASLDIEYRNYIDAIDAIDTINQHQLWKDYTHLSDEGAQIFSKLLQKDLEMFLEP
ncbi:MAG: hypothetical protein OIF50_01240 [Flavobacteriaceae bacterium]|nr:hypothetical protein [Flavobacteriaceae bacterium]